MATERSIQSVLLIRQSRPNTWSAARPQSAAERAARDSAERGLRDSLWAIREVHLREASAMDRDYYGRTWPGGVFDVTRTRGRAGLPGDTLVVGDSAYPVPARDSMLVVLADLPEAGTPAQFTTVRIPNGMDPGFWTTTWRSGDTTFSVSERAKFAALRDTLVQHPAIRRFVDLPRSRAADFSAIRAAAGTRRATGRDSIRVLSVRMDAAGQVGVPVPVTIEADVVLHSVDRGVVRLGFNSAAPQVYIALDSVEARRGSQRITFTVTSAPVDWSAVGGIFGYRIELLSGSGARTLAVFECPIGTR
jgi:hypothetical protein